MAERRQVLNEPKPRNTSRQVATKPGCAPLRDAYTRAVQLRPTAWAEVEDLFLRAMEGFDHNVANGVADMGDLQNGKGDFFNDLLALLLENCAQVRLYSRASVPGLIIPRHDLDITFPPSGPIDFVVEAKAVGTPRHPWSPKSKPQGRPGSADLDKRVKEIGFKTIDLKAEYARNALPSGQAPVTISGDLTAWLRSVKPRTYVFIAARVTSDRDRNRVAQFAHLAEQVSDGVGLFCFRPVSLDRPTTYETEAVDAPNQLARVLFRACQDLTAIRRARGIEPEPVPVGASDRTRD